MALDKIKSPDLLRDIEKCLAFQVASEVSQNEIANTVHTDVKTVGRYLDVLEKMFVIKKVRGFSRNLRNEISQKAKYYFLDNGVRNAVIGQFGDMTMRDDVGALWENFIFMELFKKSVIREEGGEFYFWRTHAGQEIDIIRENRDGTISAIECKWQGGPKRVPKKWLSAYPRSSFDLITKENYLSYLLDSGD